MAKRGIIYYNKGRKCMTRLLVSLHSLRKVYGGPVAVLCDGTPAEWFVSELLRMNADVVPLPASTERALVRKSQLWRWSPFDTTFYLDADTVVLADPSELFADIERDGFLVNWFSGWRSDGNKVGKRITQWLPVVGLDGVARAKAYGAAVNTGIHGYRRGYEMLPVWEATTRRGYALNCTRRLVDELACQVILPNWRHSLCAPEWGASVRFGDLAAAKILHYHGNKHCLEHPACAIWKREYWDYRNTSPAYAELGVPRGDRRLRRYLAATVRSDTTIVTAVNPAYEDKLRRNWPLWMATAGLREQRFLVFWNRRRPAFLDEFANVELRRWKFNAAGDNIRERMLSAFVFGTARHVKTDYWMKLDADTTPKGPLFEWPDYHAATLTAHRWGYTRVKGDPDRTRHWLNRLDDWYEERFGDVGFFQELPARERYGHKRTASFCAIEKTEFTKRLAAACGSRLPVPSQDTTGWYFAMRQSEPIQRVNMKQWLAP